MSLFLIKNNAVIDARIYQPDEDGKKKYEHLQDMMLKAIERGVIFKTVLMDTWYAITRIMQWINKLGYKFVCLMRSNRHILDRFTNPKKPSYKAVKDLPWDKLEQRTEVKLKQCSLKVKLFQLYMRAFLHILFPSHKSLSFDNLHFPLN